jgi:CrcB protein
MIITLLVSMAGGLGAVARLVLDGLIRGRHALEYPVGTTLINVSGSFLLGLLGGLALRHALPTSLHLVLGTGFLGGYTTFSAASVETVRLLQDRRCSKRFRPRRCGLSRSRARAHYRPQLTARGVIERVAIQPAASVGDRAPAGVLRRRFPRPPRNLEVP